MKKQSKMGLSLRGVKILHSRSGQAPQSFIRSPRSARDDTNNSFQRVYDVVRNIPKGKVMTYGQVALLANVATPRVVGFALHVNKDPQNIPCHRVVFANGKLTPGYAFGGEDKQHEKLREEGVQFIERKVDLVHSQAI